MNTLKNLNNAVRYIEENICGEINFDEAARIAGSSADSFMRFFSYMAGMTLSEYIRRRRLTLAADLLKNSDDRIIDVALKLGYDSADAFSRAFARQHGITPTNFRKFGGALKIYPPISFHITVKGATEMDFRIIELDETVVSGISQRFDCAGYRNREELRNKMWSEEFDNIPGDLCNGKWNQPCNTAYDGIWYGIWHGGRYMIARNEGDAKDDSLEKFTVPSGKYAAFRTAPGGLAWEELPRLFELIFDSWLPDSGYRWNGELIVEVYHLWTDHDERRKKRYYEVWIPIENAKNAAD